MSKQAFDIEETPAAPPRSGRQVCALAPDMKETPAALLEVRGKFVHSLRTLRAARTWRRHGVFGTANGVINAYR